MAKAYLGNEPYIFISYSHKDDKLVHPFIEELQASGCRVWFDDGLHIGIGFVQQIAQKIDNSSCVLAMLSKNSINSEWVYNELFCARERKKTIYPIFVEDISIPSKILMLIGTTQGAKIGNTVYEKLIPNLPNNVFSFNANMPITDNQTNNNIKMTPVTHIKYDDEKAKEVFSKAHLKENEKFINFKNHEFINKFFYTDYGQWGCTRWELSQEKNKGPQSNNMIVWIVELDGKEHDGWIKIDYGNKIIENMENGKKTFKKIHVRKYAEQYPYRIVVEKIKNIKGFNYLVRGVYKFDEKLSDYENNHYYIKI